MEIIIDRKEIFKRINDGQINIDWTLPNKILVTNIFGKDIEHRAANIRLMDYYRNKLSGTSNPYNLAKTALIRRTKDDKKYTIKGKSVGQLRDELAPYYPIGYVAKRQHIRNMLQREGVERPQLVYYPRHKGRKYKYGDPREFLKLTTDEAIKKYNMTRGNVYNIRNKARAIIKRESAGSDT